ncbi:uncharacterized protein LOC142320885 [Lycorma delicatula]|uniref:uncharacterized protein LOC142320885 n=1 Tax=Lycorma delicatula TaxID=130591 RepID=UPI003F5156FA
MRLSVVFELLLIFLIIAFAASRVIDSKAKHKSLFKKGKKHMFKQTEPNKYCACSNTMCNCCRDFNLPVIQVRGPGCAAITFLRENEFGITMKFGDRVLRNITLSGKKPTPVCMGLPGGVSKFCGRVYGIEKQGDQFKACLGLELRSLNNVEAALRVSCFRFGPGGLRIDPAEPFPSTKPDKEKEDEDDDDDYGLDDDDDDDDDDDFGLDDDDDDDDDDSNETGDNDVDSADYTGFSALSEEFLDGFFGSDSSNKKKKKPVIKEKPVPNLSVLRPAQPPVKVNLKPIKTPVAVVQTTPRNRVRSTTPKAVKTTEKFIAPSSPSTMMETPTETETPTIDDKEKEYITSTMMTITSMQVLEETKGTDETDGGGGGGGGDIIFTTTDQTTTEMTTENYSEEMQPTDRVETIKIKNKETSGSVNVADEDEDDDDEDDDDDDDVSSIVDGDLLGDDSDENVSNTESKGRPAEKDEEIDDVLEGILEEIEGDDDDKQKVQVKQRTIPLSVKNTTSTPPITTDRPITTIIVQNPIIEKLAKTPNQQIIITPPPEGGMRLYFSDPRHPPKARSPLSARSGREHRRMRLPPLGTEVVWT